MLPAGDDSQEAELDACATTMSSTAYVAAHSGKNMIPGHNDESSSETATNPGDTLVDNTPLPPQALAYNSNQYIGSYPHLAGWYAAPPPPTSQFYYQPAPQSTLHPAFPIPTYGLSPPAQYQHYSYYPTHDMRAKPSFSESEEDTKFTLTGDRQRDLRSVLFFVRKNSSATLFDIDGFIAEVAKADESGSRFVQRRIKSGNETEKRLALQAGLRSFSELWPDPFGNFMLQGIMEFGSAEMREELMTAVYAADVVDMTLNVHGCRIIQKALLVLDEVSVCKIITELQDIEEVTPFIFDPNGNHVIQKAIQVVSNIAKSAADQGDNDAAANFMNQIKFIIDEVTANVEQLSQHRYGCRVVQRVIEYCPEEKKEDILKEILACHRTLIEDQYGNYVIQQALSVGSEDLLTAIIETLTEDDSIFSYSMQKYASNVVEAMLTSTKSHHREAILNALLKDVEGTCGVIQLAMDPIANYVVKKAIVCAEGQQKEKLFAVITSNRHHLDQSPYAKYVLVKLLERRPSRASRHN